jgi:yecA family protein
MAMPAAMPPPLPDLGGRSFPLLDQAERGRLAGVLRPLPWIDGFLTAVMISPEEAEDWPGHVYAEGVLDRLEPIQEEAAASVVDDHFMHLADTLYDDPEVYRPYLGGIGDRMEAAAQWAAGFRFGIRLEPEPWRPLFENEDARVLLVTIFSLERDGDLETHSDSPFRGMPADRLERMRHTALEELPSLVLSLHHFSLSLDDEQVSDPEGLTPACAQSRLPRRG